MFSLIGIIGIKSRDIPGLCGVFEHHLFNLNETGGLVPVEWWPIGKFRDWQGGRTGDPLSLGSSGDDELVSGLSLSSTV